MTEHQYLAATDLAKLRIALSILTDTWFIIQRPIPARAPLLQWIVDEIAELEALVETEEDST